MKNLKNLFINHGVPQAIPTDDDTAFKSKVAISLEVSANTFKQNRYLDYHITYLKETGRNIYPCN